MCGIGALLWPSADPAELSAAIDRLMAPIGHRGPDGQGRHVEAPLALGHRRLAIVDLSDGGHQPMPWQERLVISFNGEIYNHVELRAELEAAGHRFRSHSDTEVLLAAYDQWGTGMLDRLNGMWAFALWDRRRRQLLLARDRFGVKPLYWACYRGGVAVASEIRQLLALGHPARAQTDELAAFLYGGKVDAAAPRTCFEGIHVLPPGCLLWCSPAGGEPRQERWYALASAVARLDPAAAVQRFPELLRRAVQLRLRSDVPVGSCLSGGLDSSAIVMLASRLRQQAGHTEPLQCLHARAAEPGLDESPLAALVAQRSGSTLHTLEPSREQVWQQMDAVVRTQEQPFASPSIFLQYALMHRARALGVPVLLDGQGADEILLGYPKYLAVLLAQAWRECGLRGFAQAWRQALQRRSQLGPLQLLQLLLGSRLGGLRLRHAQSRMRFVQLPAASTSRLFAQISAASNDMLQTQLLDLFHTNLPALLRYEDRNSMAHAIETRLPFLDVQVVEAALAMPLAARIHQGWSKYPLRAGDLLPDAVRWRTTKLAFNAPDRTWLAGHPQLQQRVLDSPLIAAICNRRGLERAWPGLTLLEQWRLFNVAAWAEVMEVRL